MELAIVLHERAGIALSDQDLADIETIRDLLRLSIQRHAVAASSADQPSAAPDIEQWLRPTGPVLTALGAAMYLINRLILRGLFACVSRGPTGCQPLAPE